MASVKPFLNRNRIFPTQQEAVAEMMKTGVLVYERQEHVGSVEGEQ